MAMHVRAFVPARNGLCLGSADPIYCWCRFPIFWSLRATEGRGLRQFGHQQNYSVSSLLLLVLLRMLKERACTFFTNSPASSVALSNHLMLFNNRKALWSLVHVKQKHDYITVSKTRKSTGSFCPENQQNICEPPCSGTLRRWLSTAEKKWPPAQGRCWTWTWRRQRDVRSLSWLFRYPFAGSSRLSVVVATLIPSQKGNWNLLVFSLPFLNRLSQNFVFAILELTMRIGYGQWPRSSNNAFLQRKKLLFACSQ